MTALSGQLALVTGASGAIGGAVARALAGAGADVILAGRDSQRLAGLASELGSRVREVAESDFAVPGAAAQLAARLAADGQGLDILVHAAGLFLNGDLAAADDLAFDRLLCVNLRSPLELTRGLLPALRRRQGQIVFVNSSVSGRRGVGLYAATKQGLRALADSLRDEVNSEGVRVLSIYPGRTASAMQQAILRAEGRDYDPSRLLSPRDVAQSILGALLLERSAEITDLHIRPMRPLQS